MTIKDANTHANARDALSALLQSWTGLEPWQIDAAFRVVDMPADCNGIETAASNVLRVIELARADGRSPDIACVADIELIFRAVRAETLSVRRIGAHRPIVIDQNDMRGKCSMNPVWTMLALTRLSTKYANRLLRLECLLLKIAPMLDGHCPDYLINSTRAVRLLSEDKNVEALAQIPEFSLDPEIAYEEIQKIPILVLTSFRMALGIALGKQKPRVTESGGGGQGGFRQIRGSVEDAAIDDLRVLNRSDAVDGASHYLYRAAQKNRHVVGIPSDDQVDDSPTECVYIFAGTDQDADDGLPKAPANAAAALAARALCLPVSNDVLTPSVCGFAVTCIVSDLRSPRDENSAVATFLLGLLLFHGVRLDDLRDLATTSKDSISLDNHTLAIPCALQFHSTAPDDWQPFLQASESIYRAPLCKPLSDFLTARPDRAIHIQQLAGSENLRLSLRNALSALMGTRFVTSLARLTNTFRNGMYEVGADYADVVLGTGSPDRDLSWCVTYTSRDSQELGALIARVYEQYSEYGRSYLDDFSLSSDDVGSDRTRVGSTRTPTPAVMQQLAQEMRDHTDSLRGDAIQFHNTFTAYTLMMLTIATASRTSAARFSRITDFMENFRWVFVSDKDNASYRGARLLYLPQLVAEQFVLYLQHLEYFERRVATSVFQDALEVVHFRRGHDLSPIRSVEFAARQRLPGILYLLDNSGRPYIPRMGQIAAHLPSGLFPPTFYPFRHYIRSVGREWGIAGNVLTYGLGHWSGAASPFGTFASMTIRTLAERFGRFTGGLMDRDGWRSLRGLDKK